MNKEELRKEIHELNEDVASLSNKIFMRTYNVSVLLAQYERELEEKDEKYNALDKAAELYARSKWDEACEAQQESIRMFLATVPNGLEYISLSRAPKPEFKP